jgi:predicted GH43/DUF377 family glycosyl hydrolase
MQYEKAGHIFKPNDQYEWMHYYAAPVTSVAFDDFIRVYFTTRNVIDEHGYFKTHITFVDCDKQDPTKVINIHNRPILEFGPPGTFDEHGTMVADVIVHNNQYYMYYMGWQRSDTVPYMNMLGLAISDDGVNFTKVSEGPVMGRNRFMPLGIGNVSVLVEDGIFHMWYTHYCPWIKTDKGYRPNYDIRYAQSTNGLDWQFGKQCIAPANANEALATPCVRRLGGKYHMWYSFRPGVDATGKSGPYHIGYATSDDGQEWQRKDKEMTMEISEAGWDSEMICYPDVLQINNDLVMFYCGNNYGKEGFGYAKLKNE